MSILSAVRGGALVCGALAACLGFGLFVYRISFVHSAERATGVVVELRPVREEHGQVGYAPVFHFTSGDSKSIEVKSDLSSSPPEYTVGQRVTVLYDPKTPESAFIDSFWDVWGLPTVVVSLSALSFCVGAAFYYEERKSSR